MSSLPFLYNPSATVSGKEVRDGKKRKEERKRINVVVTTSPMHLYIHTLCPDQFRQIIILKMNTHF